MDMPIGHALLKRHIFGLLFAPLKNQLGIKLPCAEIKRPWLAGNQMLDPTELIFV